MNASRQRDLVARHRDLASEYRQHVASASAADLHAFTYTQWLESVIRKQEHEQACFLCELAVAFGLPAGTSAEDVLREVGTFIGDGR